MFDNKALGIVGWVFVGRAVDQAFEYIDKVIVDPKVWENDLTDLVKCKELLEFIFVCVPTPMSSKHGSIDSSIVEETTDFLLEHTDAVIIIKSTVTPDVIERLAKKSPRVVYNPEFLTERNAYNDFINAEFMVLGGDRVICEKVKHLYTLCSACDMEMKTFYVTAYEASLIKYGINTYLASKVAWFNQFYDVIGDGETFDRVIDAMKEDKRIGSSHMQVPGADGKRGFGGACFPKDTAAFLNWAPSFSILSEVVFSNNRLRRQYALDDREKVQNVNYGVTE